MATSQQQTCRGSLGDFRGASQCRGSPAAGTETRLWSMEGDVRPIERREDLRSGALSLAMVES
jgi:hypothetical protein